METYRVPKGAESPTTKYAYCRSMECPARNKPQAGKAAVTKWGWGIRVERWYWECPTCEEVETYIMFRVF